MTAVSHDNRRTVLWMSGTAHAVQDGLVAAVYVLLPILAQTFGLSYAQVGLIKGLKSLAQALLELISGNVAERYGERRLLAGGLLLAGLGYILLSGATTPVIVFFCLLVTGVGGAFQHAPASALVSRAYVLEGRRSALGLYNASGDVGKLTFTGILSLGVTAGLPWQHTTLAYGLVAIFAGAMISMTLASISIGAPHAQTSSSGSADSAQAATGWGILDRRGFAGLLLAIFLDSMVQTSVLVFIAFLMLSKGVTLSLATLAAVAVLVGGMFGKAACGYLAERIGVRTAFALVQGLTLVGIFAVVVLPSLAAFVLLPLLGVVLQGSTSITYGLVDDLVHASRTQRGYAMVYATASLSSLVGPLGFGLIGDTLGISAAMTGMAIAAVLAVPPVWLIALRE